MSKKGKIIGIVAVILAFVLLLVISLVYRNANENKVEDTEKKNVVIIVVNKNAEETKYEISTDAEFLSGAMEEAEGLTFDGSMGPYGMMLLEVNGERAVYEEDNAYWSILVDGEYGMNGIDTQPVTDGTEYSLVYTLA